MIMSEPTKQPSAVLDLDVVFGLERPLVLRWEGQEYRLKNISALNALDVLRIRELQQRLQQAGTRHDAAALEKEAAEMEQLIDELFGIVCPALRESNMPFLKKFRVMTWYTDESDSEKKVTTAPTTRKRKRRR